MTDWNILENPDYNLSGIEDITKLYPAGTLWDEIETVQKDKIAEDQYNLRGAERIPFPLIDGHKLQPVEFLRHLIATNPENANHIYSMGTQHLTDETLKIKYLSQWPFTVGELAVAYLKLCQMQAGLKLNPSRSMQRSKPPIYFSGASKGFYDYVDIEACYFSLYSVATLDIRYSQRSCKVAPGSIPFYLPNHFRQCKRIRNTTAGIMAKTSANPKYINGYMVAMIKKWNSPTHRPDLTNYIKDTLMAICQEAIMKFDIYMWLTDAAVLPSKLSESFINWLQTEWALVGRIKASGPAYLYNFGCYEWESLDGERKFIGNQPRVEGYKKGKQLIVYPTSNLEPQNIPKLKKIRKQMMGEII